MLKLYRWTLFEMIWLIVFVSIATAITFIAEDSLLNYSVLISGVLCVVLAAKGNLWTYIFGMYNSLAYAYVAYSNAIYGEMGLNLFFFVPMNIIGFLMWKRHMRKEVVIMRGLSIRERMMVLLICLLSIAGLGVLLSFNEAQNTPYIDATTNVLSVSATFLMVARYKEQWLLYIVLNIFTVMMWTMRWVDGSPDGLMMIVMWTAFLINAVYGYYLWDKQSKAILEQAKVYEESRINAG